MASSRDHRRSTVSRLPRGPKKLSATATSDSRDASGSLLGAGMLGVLIDDLHTKIAGGG